jgi:hypothetical protein
MSSLQKFHRRTQSFAPLTTWPATSIGGGDVTHGYWLGPDGLGTSKLIVAPKSTETQLAWGPINNTRGTASITDGLANTNTLAGFGQSAHPAAYYCKYLTTGGYNTWYLPAINELISMFSYRNANPFVTTSAFLNDTYYWSSTEGDGNYAWRKNMTDGIQGGFNEGFVYKDKNSLLPVRPIRRYISL